MATVHAPFLAGDNRAVGLALVVSAALHLVVLLILPSLREAHQRKSEAEPLNARLVESPQKQGMAAPAPTVEPIRPRSPEVQALKQATPQSAPTRSQPPRTTP